MKREKGVLKYCENVEERNEEVEIISADRFKSSHKRKIMVIAVLNPRNRTNNKDVNLIKITNFIVKTGTRIESIKGSSFGKAEVTFIHVIQANKCSDLRKK